jgi:tetratricopeptide (TPR) repeat protein
MARRKKKRRKKTNVSLKARRANAGNGSSLVTQPKVTSLETSSPRKSPANTARQVTSPRPGVLPEKPMLSVCMIVRDEEKMLSRCLKSVQSVADELIVVDTGSEDDTVLVAKDFGARVFHFEWCDDFAAARNESLKYATGDWILQIDADEELYTRSVGPLRKAIAHPWCLLYEIMWDNGPNSPERFFKVDRLFRNHPEIRYQRAYHETVLISAKDLIRSDPRWELLHEDGIVLRHYGYEAAYMEERKKATRELRIMESYVKQDPDDTYILTRLGGVYADMDRHDEAIAVCSRALSIDPKIAEAHYYLGTVYGKKGMLDDAIEAYKASLTLDPELIGAHTGLGDVYCKKGMLDHAIAEYKNVLAKSHDSYAGSHYNLGIGFHMKGLLDEAIAEYKQALAIDPDYGAAHYNLSLVYYMNKQYELAVKHCDAAVELGIKADPRFLQDLKAHR